MESLKREKVFISADDKICFGIFGASKYVVVCGIAAQRDSFYGDNRFA
jgi:hypothetical protein